MALEILLPKLGLTMEEGVVEEWLVETGAVVREGDALMRLATDKVDVDVEAEGAGVFHPAVPAGTTLPPGAVVGWLLAEGETPPATPGAPAVTPDSADGAEIAIAAEPTTVAATMAMATADSGSNGSHAANGSNGRLFVSPNAKRVASELGIDVTAVTGTGPNGRITSEDVQAAAAAAPPVAPAGIPGTVTSPLVRRDAAASGVSLAEVEGTGPGGRVRRADVAAAAAAVPALASISELPAGTAGAVQEPTSVIPLKGMRGTIASRMVASLHEMAQLTHSFEVSMDAVVALRAQLKSDWADTDLAVPSLNDFIVRAAALALRVHPILNATIRDNAIHLLPDIHMGLAVSVPGGLMVPVVTYADRRSLGDLAAQTRALAVAARDGKITLDQLDGATFAVTSLGTYGVDYFTPIINTGNVGILGVGRLRDGVRWEGETPKRTQVLTLSLTFDHRAVDGAPAAEYLQTVAELLAKPLRLLG